MIHSTRAVVSRASQVHHTPQMGLAQMEPVMSTRVAKISHSTAEDLAMMSHLRLRFQRYMILHRKTTKKARKETQATGTWK